MKPILLLTFLLSILVLTSCEVKPQPIAYGQANCEHCKMTVSDQRYGAEIVTKTGKAFYFDSMECLAAYLQADEERQQKASLKLVTDFTKPEILIAAEEAVYLQSKNLPSPMGMFLTAFANEQAAKQMQQEQGGRILTWEQAYVAVKNNEKPE